MTTIYGTEFDDSLFGDGNDNIIYGYGGNDLLIGFGGNDYLNGGDGDDQINGGEGDDTYIYSSGIDIFSEEAGTDTVHINTTASYSAMSIYRDTENNLIFKIDDNNILKLYYQFHSSNNAFETLVFNGGPAINLFDRQYETIGTQDNDHISGIALNGYHDDIIYGFGGDDYIDAGQGNDHIYGGDGDDNIIGGDGDDYIDGGSGNDYITGGTGDDTYFFTRTSGVDTIHQGIGATYGGDGSDKILFEDGIEFSDLIIYRDHSGYFNIEIDQNNKIIIDNHFDQYSAVGVLEFSDSSIIDLTTMQITTYGSSDNDYINGILNNASKDDIIYGLDGDDYIYGYEGNDAIYGGTGNDTLYGAEDNDYINGGTGNDYVDGGTGNDTIYGGDGLDTLYGGTGADTFVFEADSAFNNTDVIGDFSISDGDTIDLSELLTGYNPVTDIIQDFITLVDNGGSTIISVDRDGAGNAYTSEAVVELSNFTGSTIDDLLNNNHIIV